MKVKFTTTLEEESITKLNKLCTIYDVKNKNEMLEKLIDQQHSMYFGPFKKIKQKGE